MREKTPVHDNVNVNSYFAKDGCILIQKKYPGSSASKGTVPEIRLRHYIRGATLLHNLLVLFMRYHHISGN